MNLRRIFLTFGLFSATIALLIALLRQLPEATWLHERIWAIYGFHVAVGLLFFMVNAFLYRKGDQIYALGAMAVLMGKLLLSGAFTALYLLREPVNSLWFVLNFMLLYLFFTIFEISVIISNLRAQKNT